MLSNDSHRGHGNKSLLDCACSFTHPVSGIVIGYGYSPKAILFNQVEGMGYKYNSQETREKIAERDGGFYCHYCGCVLIKDNRLARKVEQNGNITITSYEFPSDQKQITVDHVVPRYYGGKHNIDNLVLSCKSCNSSKGIN